MKELDDYLDAVSKRKPRLVATGQVNVAALMVLQDDDVPRLTRMLKLAVAQLERQLEDCTDPSQASGLEECFFDLRRLVLSGCVGRIGSHVPDNWFRSRPTAIQAVQWTGTNLAAVRALCAGDLHNDVAADTIAIADARGVVMAQKMDWIVKSPKGGYDVVKAGAFSELYEPA